MATTAQIPTKEAAAINCVSVKTFIRWSRSGRIKPVTKLPGLRGAFLWDREQVESLRGDS